MTLRDSFIIHGGVWRKWWSPTAVSWAGEADGVFRAKRSHQTAGGLRPAPNKGAQCSSPQPDKWVSCFSFYNDLSISSMTALKAGLVPSDLCWSNCGAFSEAIWFYFWAKQIISFMEKVLSDFLSLETAAKSTYWLWRLNAGFYFLYLPYFPFHSHTGEEQQLVSPVYSSANALYKMTINGILNLKQRKIPKWKCSDQFWLSVYGNVLCSWMSNTNFKLLIPLRPHKNTQRLLPLQPPISMWQ